MVNAVEKTHEQDLRVPLASITGLRLGLFGFFAGFDYYEIAVKSC